MSIFSLFRRPRSAASARERLQILLSHDGRGRQTQSAHNFARGDSHDCREAGSRQRENVRVRMDRGATVSTLRDGRRNSSFG